MMNREKLRIFYSWYLIVDFRNIYILGMPIGCGRINLVAGENSR